MPHIGNHGATKWTSNGTELAELAATLNLTATNTIQSCQNTTWTWQSRDGRARTRVDYILIPTRQLHKVKENTGTVTWTNITRQGTAIDHRPVALTIRITPHCETFPKKSKLQVPTRQVNISMIKETWEAWEADRKNQMTKTESTINQTHMDKAIEFQQKLQTAITKEQITQHTTMDKKLEKLEKALRETMNETFPQLTKPPKQIWMTEELTQQLQHQADLWHKTRVSGMQLGFWGWERKLRLLTNTKNNPLLTQTEIIEAVIDCMPSTIEQRNSKAIDTVTQWEQWREITKTNKRQTKTTNISHIESVVAKAREAQDKKATLHQYGK